MTRSTTADFLIIGGGIMGLNLALEARRRHPAARITVLEKESQCGRHASGRNSGVLHAGFYYTADSLKARFTREGNRLLTAYCQERGLRVNTCGKLVVTRNPAELSVLDELLQRGRRNQVELHDITDTEARHIEPRVRTYYRALFSPTTSSVDPIEVMQSFARDAAAAGITVLTGVAYRGRAGDDILTDRGRISPGYVINAAGLYADRIARDFGFSQDYRILPFKGLYLYSSEPPGALRTHVYPVPDLQNPFLGVHYTVTVDGRIKIGPTAIPALWREHYSGLGGFRLGEAVEVIGRELAMLARNDFNFRALAAHELRKYSRTTLVSLASQMASGVDRKDYRKWGSPGIRAQLVNIRTRKLEMDFRHEGDRRSFHVLNAVSPAFTCAMPFAQYLFTQVERQLSA